MLFYFYRLQENAHKVVHKNKSIEIPRYVGISTLEEATAKTQESEKLFFGLPPVVRKKYAEKGISKLYG